MAAERNGAVKLLGKALTEGKHARAEAGIVLLPCSLLEVEMAPQSLTLVVSGGLARSTAQLGRRSVEGTGWSSWLVSGDEAKVAVAKMRCGGSSSGSGGGPCISQ